MSYRERGRRAHVNSFSYRRAGIGAGVLSFAAALLASAAVVTPVQAEPVAESPGIETVVVTAEKREENVNKVGMAIQAFSGEQLKEQRVTDVSSLSSVVPSFNVSQGYMGVPIFTLRGIGFNTINLSATSTVGTYVDEVAYAYPFMMSGPLYDMQRVEVLKGPQGTLYGRNTTAGLIDLITNKPTDTFQASITAEVGNYGTHNFEGFVSGPLTDTLKGRLAFRTEDSDEGWQVSNTRPGDRLGEKHNYGGRLELEWQPMERLKVSFTASGWINKSDPVAGQAIGLTTANQPGSLQYCLQAPGPFSASWNPVDATPYCPGVFAPPGYTDLSLQHYMQNNFPTKGSQADWEPAAQRMADIGTGLGIHKPLGEDDQFYTFVGRVDYTINDELSVVSLTAYNHVKRDAVTDWSGAPYEILVQHDQGHIGSFSQELRLQGDEGAARWMVGGYYANDTIYDGDRTMLGQNANVPLIRYYGLGLLATPYNSAGYTVADMSQAFRTYSDYGAINSNTWSMFANGDYRFDEEWKVTAGIRYTEDRQHFTGCSYDFNGNMLPNLNVVNRYLYTNGGLLYNPALPLGYVPSQISQGDCVTYHPDTGQFGVIESALDENNVAWRVALDWTPEENTLLYATVSKGYKVGNIPIVAANISTQEVPAKQEQLLSYEAGVKTRVFDGRAQINASAFYYDYKDKQLSVLFADPIYTVLARLANIPQSHAYGFDADVTVALLDHLTAMVTATYVQTYIGSYLGVDNDGSPKNFKGSHFPYSPRWSGGVTLTYQAPMTDTLGILATVNAKMQSRSCADLCTDPVFSIKSYGLLNASIGVQSLDGVWQVSLWGRNLTNTYYWTSVAGNADVNVRFPGMTRTYGVSLTYNFE